MALGMFRKRFAVIGPLLILVLLAGLLPPFQVFAAPSISLDSVSGPAGTGITVQGNGWPVGDQIGVQWQDGRPIGGSVGSVSGTGNFAGYFYVPQDATPGTYTVVFQATQNPSITAQVSFRVTSPTITLQPNSGPAGTAVTATGSGWPGGKDIEFSWDVNNFLGSAIADAAGTVTFNFNVPTNASQGNHAVLANFTNGDIPVEVQVNFTVTTAAPQADLSITQTDSPDPVAWGQALDYRITATNNGPSNASNVTIVDTLPGNVLFTSAITGQWNCTGPDGSTPGGTMTCTRPTLPNGASDTILITVSPPNAAGTLTNRATVSANQADPNTANNTANAVTTLVTYSISGNVYVDTNENGVKDPGESSYADAIVVLTGAATNSTATDPSGNYTFTSLQTGSFIITLTLPAGYHATTTDPRNILLTANTTVNFGIAPNPSPTCTQAPPPPPLPNDIVADFQQTRDDYCFANWSDHTLEEKIDAQWKAIINEYKPSELPSFLVQKTLLPITKKIYGADGLCYGMANSSLTYWQYSDLKPRQVATYQLSKDESKDKIVEYHTLQIWETFNPSKIRAGTFLEDPKSEYQKLENYLKQGKPVLLNLMQGGNLFAEGHTVVAYRIHKSGSIMTVYVYDSNAPGVPLTATFNTKTNAFQYILDPYNFTGFYVAEARMSVPDNARELIRSTFNAINDWFRSNNLFQLQLHSPVTGLVIDKQGRRLGYIGQLLVNEIPNAEMFKLGEETYFYLPTSGEYTLTTTGTSQATNTSTMGVDVIIPIGNAAVKWITYNNVPVHPSSTAQVKVSVSNTDYVMQLSNNAPLNPNTIMAIRPSSVYVPLIKK